MSHIFISGGCKNGKSTQAQIIAKRISQEQNLALYYVATMIPADAEDEERIQRHIAERAGWGFTTLEQAYNLTDLMNGADLNGVFLIDSLTALLANHMFPAGRPPDLQAGEAVREQIRIFTQYAANIVFVSDYIYCDAAVYDSMTERYRRELALTDAFTAGICGTVIEVVHGGRILHKGAL